MGAMPALRRRDGFAGQRLRILPRPLLQEALLHHLDAVGGAMPSDLGFFPRAAGHEVSRPAGCPELVLILCLRGRGWGLVDGRRYELAAGQLLALPPGRPHAYGADERDPWSIAWLHLAGPRAGQWSAVLAAEPVRTLADPWRCAALIEEACDLAERAADPAAARACAAAAAHALALCALPAGGAGDGLERALAAVRADLARPWTVAAMAAAAGLSASRFTVRCRAIHRLPPLRWLAAERIEAAARLLATTGLPVQTVAGRVGFADPLHFSRRFRALKGVPPSRWRAAGQSLHPAAPPHVKGGPP